jgi:hypothetical protein
LLARGIAAVVLDAADERDALAGYQAIRDTLSASLFDVVDLIAGLRWTDEEIPELLLQLSEAMADEVEALAALPSIESEGRLSPAGAVGGRREGDAICG